MKLWKNALLRRAGAGTLALLIGVALTGSAGAGGAYSSVIKNILSDYEENNDRCESAPQQSVNGAYRSVELLGVIAYELDSSGAYSPVIKNILSDYEENNDRCESAPQQSVNGAYRSVELLGVVAMLLDR